MAKENDARCAVRTAYGVMTMKKSYTYLTTKQLSERLSYTPGTIRDELKDSVLIEGIHYIRPFGGRKILFIWEVIEEDMRRPSTTDALMAGLQ